MLSLKDKKNLVRDYLFEISESDLKKYVEEEIPKIAPGISEKGYRKGNVPYDIIEKKYKKDLISECFTKQLEKALKDEVQSSNLKPAGQIIIEDKGLDLSDFGNK